MNKKKINIIIDIVCFLLWIVSYLLNFKIVLFSLIFINLLRIIFKAKFSLFSVLGIFSSYIALPVLSQDVLGKSYGLLEQGVLPLYPKEIYFLLVLFNISILLLCEYTKVLEKEKLIYKINVPNNKLFCYVCAGIAVVFSIIAFPSFGGDRFNSLLPGSAWNHLVLVSLIFLAFYMKDSKIAIGAFIFAIVWFLIHGERVDMLGYIIGLALIIINRYDVKFNYKKVLLSSAMIVSFFVVFIIVGMIRNSYTVNIANILYSFIIQPTAADVAYVLNSSIYYSKTEKLYYGITYLKNLSTLIPLVDTPYLAQNILTNLYKAPGGEYYYCESILNLGIYIGPFFSTIIFLSVIYLLIKSNNRYLKICTLLIVCGVPRLIWYGRNYFVTSITIFIPCMLLCEYLVNRIDKKKLEMKENNEV